MTTNSSGLRSNRQISVGVRADRRRTKAQRVGLRASFKMNTGRRVVSGSSPGSATEVGRGQLIIGCKEGNDLQLEGESVTQERKESTKRLPPEGKASHLAETEARLAADDARRIRVLRAWGPLYFLYVGQRTAHETAAPCWLWASRIIDTVAALEAEDLVGRLDDINSRDRDTPQSRAAKYAVKVYRLAIEGGPKAVAKAVAEGMRGEGPTFTSQSFRKHFEEMLRWRIMLGVFRDEWRQFTLAELECELERLSAAEPAVPTV